MNSFILVSKNPEKRKEYVNHFVKINKVSTFDQINISSQTSSVGIETIRDMQKNIFYKPLHGDKKIIVIEDANTLTTEAQNSLLKILEEPPIHTFIFLSSSNSNFLPTILSRCKVVILEKNDEKITDEKESELLNDYAQLVSGDVSFKLYLAEKLSSDKENIKGYLENFMQVLRTKMLKEPNESREVLSALEQLQNAYTTIQTTNVNLRLLLEHTFLAI